VVTQPDADPARRSRLLAIKLSALVRDHLGDADVELGVLGGFAALQRDGEAWVLADQRPERALGPAMAWARQQGLGRLHVLAEDGAGVLARRAVALGGDITVWQVDGRSLTTAAPAAYTTSLPVPAELKALRELIIEGGATPVVEHGVLMGEVAGLEVCRAVLDPFTSESRLEVGVGAHDREAFTLMHGSIPTSKALADVARTVAEHRRANADPHPLNRLGAERLLRHRLLQRPEVVGAVWLQVAEPPVARENIKDPVPCVATGRTVEGEALVIVCSTGVDLDLIPFAADARGYIGDPSAKLIVVVPDRDRYPVTVAAAAVLPSPAELVGYLD
jgi:hypothetical protein